MPCRMKVTGMGAENARRVIRDAFAEEIPPVVITSGFAGGLNPTLKTGDVLWDCDDDFHVRLGLLESIGRQSSFHCAKSVLVTREEKAQLFQSTRCDGVEMESAIIREFCKERNIPSMTLRVVSDSANENMPLDFNKIVDVGMNVRPHLIAWQVLTHFWKIPALIQFQGTVKRASKTLAKSLKDVVEGLSDGGDEFVR